METAWKKLEDNQISAACEPLGTRTVNITHRSLFQPIPNILIYETSN